MYKALRESLKVDLHGPGGVVAGIAIGAGLGIYFKPVAHILAPFGQIYVSLLMMCILPIIITSMTSGLAKLMRTAEIGRHLKRLATYFVLGLLVPSGVGALIALVSGPGEHLSTSTMASLGAMVLHSETSAGDQGLLPFIVSIVPSNIFESLSKGHIVSIVFSCILIGLALGLVQNDGVDDIVRLIDVISDSFKLIFNWALRILPIGIGCILAGQLAHLSLDIFRALVEFIVIFHLTALLLGLLYNALLWQAVGGPFFGALRALGKPLLLAYMVDSSLVALSSCLDVLEQRLAVDRRMSGLLLPFGMVANRQGKICLFAFTAVFLAQIHAVPLGFGDVLVVVIASSLAGMAAVGSGVILATSLVVVLHAIAVPDVLAPIVLIAAGPLVDRIQSSMTVLGNCTLVAMTAKQQGWTGGSVVEAEVVSRAIEPQVD